MAGRPKGTPKTGGRVAGTPNKNTAAIKDMIATALDKVGGVEYLVHQAEENPNAFMTLVGKVIPTQVESKVDLAMTMAKEQRDAAVAAAARADG